MMMLSTVVTVLQLLVVVTGSGNESSSAGLHVSNQLIEPMLSDDVEGCYVVTIFGLKTADCDKHRAKSIPTSLDSDLQVLRFEDNRLTVLGDGQFSSYANLQEIYLARNRLELIEATAFRGLYSLQILDLEANQLSAVPAKSLLAVASSLRLLNLKNNPIRRLEADSLSSLTRLEEINFEDCWLEYISPAAFSGLERLSALNLVNNELRSLDSAMRATLPTSLRVLRLYRNPWKCNCRLRWLRRWLASPLTRTGSIADAAHTTINWDFASNTPTCAAPALIRGVAWRHLTSDQFACPSRIIAVSSASSSGNGTTTTGIRAAPGLNATVECMAAGDPEPIISWSRGDGDGHVLAPPRALISVTQGTVGDDGEPRIVSVLTLVRVSAARDSGVYSCMAENTAGRAEMTFKLIVADAPLADTSTTGLWPIDRDAFVGTLLGLLAVVCIVVLCTVLRLRNVARHRRRRLHNKNVYYVTDTANHVGPLPTSNHCPPTDVESTPTPAHTAAAVDDEDSKSSEEQPFLGDEKTTIGSPRYPLLPNHNQHWSERSAENGRHGKKKYSEASGRRERVSNSVEARSLLGTDVEREMEPDNSIVEDVICDNDDGLSVSDKLSDDVISDDVDDSRTDGDDAANHRERPSRAVSFGPDMIIDARCCSSSVEDRDDDSPHDDDDVLGGEVKCDSHNEDRAVMSQRHDEPVFQRSAVNCSPSVDRCTVANRSSTTTDRRTTGLSVGDSPPLTYVGVGAERCHSGESELVGNGSVCGGLGSRVVGRSLSPQTPTSAQFGRSRPSSQSASLERTAGDKNRRRLPVPVPISRGLRRRSPGPGMFGGRQGVSSPLDVALPGNHVADCTPVSLAQLLTPPFGSTAVALRRLQQARQAGKAETGTDPRRSAPLQHRSNANCIFDDDSGTNI